MHYVFSKCALIYYSLKVASGSLLQFILRNTANYFVEKNNIAEDQYLRPKWFKVAKWNLSSIQSLSRVRLCDPMNRSTPGLPVHHQLLESTQTHAHRVGDTIQPSHPLLSSSPPALNLSQHQGFFKWVSMSHQVAGQSIGVSASKSVLPMNTQDWSRINLFFTTVYQRWCRVSDKTKCKSHKVKCFTNITLHDIRTNQISM